MRPDSRLEMAIRRIPLLCTIVAGVLALGGPAVHAAPAKKPAAQTVPGDLIVGFRSDVSAADQQKILKGVGADEKRNFKKIHGSLAHLVSGDVDAAIAKLERDPRVRYAEPNHVITIDSLPNDPAFGTTWGMTTIGAPQAWDLTTGSPSVTVAVIDTGVDWSHPDLSSEIWLNPGENCAGCRTDGVDNDGNGYVDDWHGWDFVGNDNNPTDDHGHGTHVAGTIGAAGNNGVGVAGVNWNVRIMPVKFLDAQGSGTDANAVSAVLYAAQNGADVLNNSWADNVYSQALADAIAVADQHDSLFVAAAGNDGTDNDSSPTYPASYDNPNVLTVAATDSNDNRASFSNVGRRSVDLGAPGVNIYSTWTGGGYQSASGTSMATPHVAGAAALAKAEFPSASAAGLKALLLGTVDPKPALATTTASGGRLNVANAVRCDAAPQVWIDQPGPAFVVDAGTPISLSVLASECADPRGVTVSATANGAPVALTPRGDGVYSATFTPAGGPVTFSATASDGATSTTRSVTGMARSALSISPGGPALTVTSVGGESITVKLNGTAGERVSLGLARVTMTLAQVTLVAPSGAALASTYGGASGGFLGPVTLPVTGAYTINVAPYAGAAGSVTLQLYDVPPDASASAVAGGAAVSLTTTTPGQNARVTFAGSAGQRVSVQISNATFQFALLSFVKPDGTLLGNNRFIAAGTTFVDTTALPSSGTYVLVLDPNGASTGSASLQLDDVPPDAGGPIAAGMPVMVATTVPGQNGRLTFAGTAGQRISLKISNVTYASATAQLLDPSGNAVGANVFVGTGGAFVDTRVLPSTGTYTLTLDPPNATVGSATFTLYNVPSDVSGTVMAGGGSFATTLSVPGQNAKYTFAGAAGQRISLSIAASSMAMGNVTITAPNGASVVNALFGTFATFTDTRTLPASGTYTLTVDPQKDATGNLSMTLYDVPADVTAALAIGLPPQPVVVTTPGQNARLTFSGSAGRAVALSFTNSTISVSFVSILKPDGTQLGPLQSVGSFARTLTVTPPVDGIYTVVVDPQGTATGSLLVGAS